MTFNTALDKPCEDIKEIKQGLATKAEASALQALQEEVAQKGADTELRTYVDDQVKSLNPDYEDVYLSESDDIRTIGEVIEIYREN